MATGFFSLVCLFFWKVIHSLPTLMKIIEIVKVRLIFGNALQKIRLHWNTKFKQICCTSLRFSSPATNKCSLPRKVFGCSVWGLLFVSVCTRSFVCVCVWRHVCQNECIYSNVPHPLWVGNICLYNFIHYIFPFATNESNAFSGLKTHFGNIEYVHYVVEM